MHRYRQGRTERGGRGDRKQPQDTVCVQGLIAVMLTGGEYRATRHNAERAAMAAWLKRRTKKWDIGEKILRTQTNVGSVCISLGPLRISARNMEIDWKLELQNIVVVGKYMAAFPVMEKYGAGLRERYSIVDVLLA